MRAVTLGAFAVAVVAGPAVTGAFAAFHPSAQERSDLVLVASKGQHTCGTHMYWSMKEGKCIDAREKSAGSKEGEPPGWVSQCMKGKAGC